MLKPLAVSFRPAALAVATASMFVAMPARATVVLDSFGPSDSAGGTPYTLSPINSLAVAFTLDTASTITDILTSIAGNGSFTLGVVAGAGLPSGAFVQSTVLTDPKAASASGLGWTLEAGSYWLVSRPAADGFGGWAGGGQPGNAWAFASSGSWTSGGTSDAPAARITVTAIPEPGTWALMLGGLAVCAAAVRRQRG
jgi:PEP-CTERM motif